MGDKSSGNISGELDCEPERFVILIMSWLLGKLENHDIKGALSLAAPPLCSLIRQMLQPEGAALSGVNCSRRPSFPCGGTDVRESDTPLSFHLRLPFSHSSAVIVFVSSVSWHRAVMTWITLHTRQSDVSQDRRAGMLNKSNMHGATVCRSWKKELKKSSHFLAKWFHLFCIARRDLRSLKVCSLYSFKESET